MPEPPDEWAFDTRAVTAGREWSRDSLAPVLFPSTTYQVEAVDDHRRMAGTPRTAHYYSRFGSPSVQEFEQAVASLEGAEAALASASGMAALTGVIFGLCSTGDHIVAQRQLFSITSLLLSAHVPRFGIEVTFVDGTDTAEFADAIRPGRTQLVLVETPANPALSLTDIEAVAALPGPFTVVDSTFATPVLQSPLERGADLVLHAATKGLAGHNDALLGVVAGERDLIDALWGWQSVQGGQASPFDAWNGLRGIRTLGVRVRQQCATAQALAEHLEAHPAVASVSYPGLDSHPQRDLAKRQMRGGGTTLAVELAGGFDAARRFCESTRIARIALSLGGPETLVTHPATIAGNFTPEERADLGISDGLVRVSVGLEDVADLVADVDQALAAATA
ncbi:MAG TPA: aminotransferase class I/II-fold pyridoxal phosphate-dependent enzyme [Acidimicrobiales bacterium]|nr:aminotransferase class I/II-fold pyridoxal phosphate-dependent enzyme [Acidimicrobiales bacterium]